MNNFPSIAFCHNVYDLSAGPIEARAIDTGGISPVLVDVKLHRCAICREIFNLVAEEQDHAKPVTFAAMLFDLVIVSSTNDMDGVREYVFSLSKRRLTIVEV